MSGSRGDEKYRLGHVGGSEHLGSRGESLRGGRDRHGSQIAVSVGPGDTRVNRTPEPRNSAEQHLVQPTQPVFAGRVCGVLGKPVWSATLPTRDDAAPTRVRAWRAGSRAPARTEPTRLTASCASKSADRGLLERPEQEDAGVAHDDVGHADLARAPGGQRRHRPRIAHVAGQIVEAVVRPRLRASRDPHHPRARAGERLAPSRRRCRATPRSRAPSRPASGVTRAAAPVRQAEKLVAGLGVVPEDPAQRARDRAGVLLLHAAHHHAEVGRLDDDPDARWAGARP